MPRLMRLGASTISKRTAQRNELVRRSGGPSVATWLPATLLRSVAFLQTVSGCHSPRPFRARLAASLGTSLAPLVSGPPCRVAQDSCNASGDHLTAFMEYGKMRGWFDELDAVEEQGVMDIL